MAVRRGFKMTMPYINPNDEERNAGWAAANSPGRVYVPTPEDMEAMRARGEAYFVLQEYTVRTTVDERHVVLPRAIH